jgi:nucleotide-binding universal stress UspA family protein
MPHGEVAYGTPVPGAGKDKGKQMKILICTDGSEFSENAAREVCRLIPNLNERSIKVVCVYESYPVAMEPFAAPAEYYQSILDAAREQAAHHAASTASIIRENTKDGDINLGVEVIQGSPERDIIQFAETWGADLIVVGSHGRGFWGRLLGSVSDAVVHHAPCSVLVVRKDGNSPWLIESSIERSGE